MTFDEIYNDHKLRRYIHFKTKTLFEGSNLSAVMQHQDLEQLTFIKIMKDIDSLPRYKHILGFLSTCIKRTFLGELEYYSTEKRNIKEHISSVKLDDKSPIDENLTVADVICDDSDFTEDITNIMEVNTKYKTIFTTERDKQIMLLLIDGYSQSDIARVLNMKPSNVTRRMKVFKERMTLTL